MLKEYKERDKSNVFMDKRFGEYNSSMSAEEKMARRFALEQQVWRRWGPAATCLQVQRVGLESWAQAGEARGKGGLQTPLADPYGSQRAPQGCVLEFALKCWLQLGWVDSMWPVGHSRWARPRDCPGVLLESELLLR